MGGGAKGVMTTGCVVKGTSTEHHPAPDSKVTGGFHAFAGRLGAADTAITGASCASIAAFGNACPFGCTS